MPFGVSTILIPHHGGDTDRPIQIAVTQQNIDNIDNVEMRLLTKRIWPIIQFDLFSLIASYYGLLCYFNQEIESILLGELKAGQSLDREEFDNYMLTVHVQDREILQWECMSYVEILVSDVNDNSPLFDSNNFTVNIQENTPIGSPIFKVQATDFDSGILYALILVTNHAIT